MRHRELDTVAVGVILAVILAAGLVAVGGCSYVTPSDREVIHAHRLNAEAMAASVQADPNLPPYAARWWRAEARTWRAMDAWARGEDIEADPNAGGD